MGGGVITATVFGGQVTLLTIVNQGSGYTSPPTILIQPPSNPLSSTDQAKATCTIGLIPPNVGKIVTVTITNNGANYTSTPDVFVLDSERAGLPNPQGWQTTEIISNTPPGISELYYAVSYRAAYNTIRNYNLRLGRESGGLPQSNTGHVALGYSAGSLRQGTAAVAIGSSAGERTQGEYAVAIGYETGKTNQGNNSVAIGYQSGLVTQGDNSIAIGNQAGTTNQGSGSIALGYLAGFQQSPNSVVISALGSVVTGAASGSYLAPIRNLTQGNIVGYDTNTNELTYFPSSSSTIPNGTFWGQGLNWDDSLNVWQLTGNGPLAFANNAGRISQGTSAISLGINAGEYTQSSGSIAIGFNAGQTNQQTNSIAIGVKSGQNIQSNQAIAIGFLAGQDLQGTSSISFGNSAGQTFQGQKSIAIGNFAGSGTQGENSIAIGNESSRFNQGSGSIAIGYLAGSQQATNSIVISALGTIVTGSDSHATYIAPIRNISQPNVLAYNTSTNEVSFFPSSASTVPTGSIWGQGINWNDTTDSWQITGDGPLAFGNYAGQNNQGTNAIAFGIEAGRLDQNSGSIAVGFFAGKQIQGSNAIAIGINAGSQTQGENAISLGTYAGQTVQNKNAIAIGYGAGQGTQQSGAISLGFYAGQTFQGINAIAIGANAGSITQGNNSLAIGYLAGSTNQGSFSIAIGSSAGCQTQGINAIAIGTEAGENFQNSGSIALGYFAGFAGQGTNSLAIGTNSGQTNQGTNAIALGFFSGQGSQGENSIAIGNESSRFNQGSGSIAIGYLAGSQQAQNSIVINALGSVITGASTCATYLAPLRNISQPNVMAYNTSTHEVSFFPSSASTVPTGSIWGQGINWNDTTDSWQITGDGPLAFGNYAGQTNQGTSAIAIGIEAGKITQSSGAIALGFQAGITGQGTQAIAMGSLSGQFLQGVNSIAIGHLVASTSQNSGAVAIGLGAAQNVQGTNSISIGVFAGNQTQGTNSISIGNSAGFTFQGENSVSLGWGSGSATQGNNSIALGTKAGQTFQNNEAISIGFFSGSITQGSFAIAIGSGAGQTNQGSYAIALGSGAGGGSQNENSISIGKNAGNFVQGSNSIAIGLNAGFGTQGANSLSIGNSAGQTGQQSGSIAVGYFAGNTFQGINSIAIGNSAGLVTQGSNAIAIGYSSAVTGQGSGSIAIGYLAGAYGVTAGATQGQGMNSIAIGNSASTTNQGSGAIAIGYLAGSQQASNSVVINALGTVVTGAASGSYLAPIRNLQTNLLIQYNTDTNELSYSENYTGSIGQISARQIDSTYLEMNGQILDQTTYSTLYYAIGNQPEYIFNRVNLNPGLFSNSNLSGSSIAAGNYNADKNGNTLIMVGTNGLIMRSTDNGTTWSLKSFQSVVSGVVGLNVIRYVSNWGYWILGGSGSNIQGYSSDDGITWSTPSTGNYNRFAFDFNPNSNVGIFVGSGSFIYRSTNGITWTSIITILQTPVIGFTTFPTLYSVTYGRVGGTTDTWVAVGDRSTLIYSTDNGFTWSVYAFPLISSSILYYVKYIGGTINRFYAVGVDEIFYSSDGISWTLVTNVNFNTQYQIISDSAQTCVVICSSSGINYSTDGTTFNVYTPTAANAYYAITFDAVSSKFFATGAAGMIELAYVAGILSAPVRYTLSRNVNGRCILVGGSKIYMGTDNAGVLNYDISSTVVATSVEPGYNLRRVAYGNNVYVTISLDSRSSLFYSTDALNWTYVALDSVTYYTYTLYDIKYFNNRFVVTANGVGLWESTNGSTWTLRTTPSYNKYVVIWTTTNYIFGCNTGTILYSSDLITFTAVSLFTAPSTGEDIDVWDLNDLGSGVVVAVMSNGWISRSTNHGVTWSTQYISPVGSYSFVNLAYNSVNDILTTCTREGAIIAYSTNKGITWNVYEAPTPYSGSTLQGIVFGNGVFLAYGTINMIGVSTNGSNWEWVATPGGYDIYSITFSGTVFMAAGLLNNVTARAPPVILWSLDGRNWTQKVVPHSLILGALGPKQEVFYGGGKWFIPSYASTQSSILWVADTPYDFSTDFQIPTRYLGTGTSKLWIKAS